LNPPLFILEIIDSIESMSGIAVDTPNTQTNDEGNNQKEELSTNRLETIKRQINQLQATFDEAVDTAISNRKRKFSTPEPERFLDVNFGGKIVTLWFRPPCHLSSRLEV
jgi:hypothetical protein